MRVANGPWTGYNVHMERLSVYVETTIPSAIFSVRSDPFSVTMRETTRLWWDTRRQDFDLFTSVATEDELSAGRFPNQEEMISLVAGIARLEVSPDVKGLAQLYAREKLVPRLENSRDAVHLAAACFNNCDALLTWNISHLANPNKVDHLITINGRINISTPKILTPEHLMEPWP